MPLLIKIHKLVVTGAFALTLGVMMASTPANAAMFGREATENQDLSAFKKWAQVQKKVKQGPAAVVTALAAPAKHLPLRQKLESINSLVNQRIGYVEDAAGWGKSDYWATPSETLAKGYGDCDDYAILKYYTLLQAGVPAKDMRVVILRDTAQGVLHAVLAVTAGDTNYILDNRFNTLYTDSGLPSYRPIYALNDTSWLRFI